jgi:HEAT repeat protein
MATSLPALIEQLNSNDAAQQVAAAEALARLGNAAQPAAKSLVAALRSADPALREWCAAALEELGPPPAAQIPELTQLAADGSLDAAYWAITLLGRAATDAAPAVNTLARVLQAAADTALRERAAWALGKIGKPAAGAAPALRQAAAGDNSRLRRVAEQALVAIGN